MASVSSLVVRFIFFFRVFLLCLLFFFAFGFCYFFSFSGGFLFFFLGGGVTFVWAFWVGSGFLFFSCSDFL